MNRIKAILFDLDGTILDSKDSIIDAVYKTVEKYSQKKITYKDIEARFGEAFDKFIELLAPARKEDIMESYLAHVENHHDELVSLFPNVKKILKQLKEQGIKLGIVTNKQRTLTIRALKLFNIEHLFDTIITLDDVKASKPDPKPILKAINDIKIDHEHVLMVGDTIFDIKSAQNAHVKVAILDWYKSFDSTDAQPDYLFSNLNELISYFSLDLKKVGVKNG